MALVPAGLDEPRRSAIATAAAFLSLAVERRAERRSVERRLRERALLFLLRDDPRTATVLLGAGETPVRVPGRIRVLRAAGPRDALADALDEIEHDGVLAAIPTDELVVVAVAAETSEIVRALAGGGLRVGVGSAVAAASTSASHETAGHALDQTNPASPVRRWDDLTGAGPMGLIPPDLAASFADSVLGPLDPRLVETLASFVRHHGSRGAMADDLGLHRNTVRNRIAEIERRLDALLDDPQTRVTAWIALRARPGAA